MELPFDVAAVVVFRDVVDDKMVLVVWVLEVVWEHEHSRFVLVEQQHGRCGEAGSSGARNTLLDHAYDRGEGMDRPCRLLLCQYRRLTTLVMRSLDNPDTSPGDAPL